VCLKLATTHEHLSKYDLVILVDLRNAALDKAAMKSGELPEYIEVLSMTDAPWTTAMLGKYYYMPHEVPRLGGRENRASKAVHGAPFLDELFSLPNFCGKLVTHAPDGLFSANSEILRGIHERGDVTWVPLPFTLGVAESDALGDAKREWDFAVLGRFASPKMRHCLHRAWDEHSGTHASFLHAGAAGVAMAPSRSFILFEELCDELGYDGWRDLEPHSVNPLDKCGNVCGIQKNALFHIARAGNTIDYIGQYVHHRDVATRARVHVGITDCQFSGGLFEYATLEAIDGGMIPVVTREFTPSITEMRPSIVEYPVSSDSKSWYRAHGPVAGPMIADAMRDALRDSSDLDRRRHNRDVICSENDPRITADVFSTFV